MNSLAPSGDDTMCHLSRRRMSCQISRPTWCVQPRRSCLATSGCWAGYVALQKGPPPAQDQGSCSAAGGFGRERCVAGASGDAGKAGKAGNANSLDESAPKFKPPSALNGSNCSQTQPHFAVVCKLTGHILGESPAISRLTLTRYVALYFFKHPRWSRGKRGI
ncbi:hypothetical protein VTI28DRAFT_5420 [Corynascus sepedonium]